MRKAERAKEQLKKYTHLFSCPVCGTDMTMAEDKSLVCGNRHNFDVAKSGYINLLQRSVKTDYDRELLAARNLLAKSGFFAPLLSVVSALLREWSDRKAWQRVALLDAGCGEGSHLSAISTRLGEEMKADLIGVGVDLAREGIQMAVKNNPDLIWCVADLAKLPLKNDRFGMIMNILSPANYREFSRVLNAEGVLVKVVPGEKYLTELRGVFFAENDKKTYSNERVIRHFAKHFQLVAQQKTFYQFPLEVDMLESLLKMTPLSWHVPKEKVDQVVTMGLKEVTVDFEVLVGRKA